MSINFSIGSGQMPEGGISMMPDKVKSSRDALWSGGVEAAESSSRSLPEKVEAAPATSVASAASLSPHDSILEILLGQGMTTEEATRILEARRPKGASNEGAKEAEEVPKVAAGPLARGALLEQAPDHPVDIEVNGVCLQLNSVAYDVGESSICCLIKNTNLKFKIPPSESVRITVEEKDYLAVYIGSWHHFASLGLQVVLFLRKDFVSGCPGYGLTGGAG